MPTGRKQPSVLLKLRTLLQQPNGLNKATCFEQGISNSPTSKLLFEPPVLVIRATCDYDAKNHSQLSFRVGEFFHVIDLHTDSDGCPWYLSQNPSKEICGLVPSYCFKKYAPLRTRRITPIEYKDNTIPRASQVNSLINNLLEAGKHRPSSTVDPSSSKISQENYTFIAPMPFSFRTLSLYGIVRHRFVAERPDELSAEPGDPVVIIAHSAEEWFVVKPIGQLGGPGLIPVSYVDVRDLKSGRSIEDADVLELVRNSAIPQVQQWKAIVASYKGCSIDVGEGASSDSQTRISGQKVGIEKAEERPPEEIHVYLPDLEIKLNDTEFEQEKLNAQTISILPSAVPSCNRPNNLLIGPFSETSLETVPEEVEDEFGYVKERFGTIRRATVTSFHFEQGKFWFEVRLRFRRPNNEKRTNLGLVIYRLYEHFQELDSSLRHESASELMLVNLNGPVKLVDELVCAKRVDELNKYLQDLCQLPDEIRDSEAVCQFINQKEGDMEMEEDELGHEINDQVDIFEFVSQLSTTPSSKAPTSEEIQIEHYVKPSVNNFADENGPRKYSHESSWPTDSITLDDCFGGKKMDEIAKICVEIEEEFSEVESLVDNRL